MCWAIVNASVTITAVLHFTSGRLVTKVLVAAVRCAKLFVSLCNTACTSLSLFCMGQYVGSPKLGWRQRPAPSLVAGCTRKSKDIERFATVETHSEWTLLNVSFTAPRCMSPSLSPKGPESGGKVEIDIANNCRKYLMAAVIERLLLLCHSSLQSILSCGRNRESLAEVDTLSDMHCIKCTSHCTFRCTLRRWHTTIPKVDTSQS